jgi:hypothetical protein
MGYRWLPHFVLVHIRGVDKSNHFHHHEGQWSRPIRVALRRCIQYASLVDLHPRRPPKKARRWLTVPENKIKRIAFIWVVNIASTLASEIKHLLATVVTDRSEIRAFTDVEIHRTTDDIGVSPLKDHPNKTPNICDR